MTNTDTATTTLMQNPTTTAPTARPQPPARHWTGTDESSAWLQAARALVPDLASAAAELDRRSGFVHDGVAALRERRMLSMLVPSELGGGGATHAEAGAVLAELAHGCPATSLTFSMHLHLVAAQVWRHHRGLPAPVLPRVANEQLVLVSTGASDWLTSSGSARKVDGGYRITARKAPSSGAPAGQVLITSVRWEDAPEGPQVLHCSVPFSAEGLRVEETWDTMGMRATGSHTVVLDDVFVPDAAVALVRPAGQWHPIWATVLGCAMPLIMSTYVGVAESAATQALALATPKADRPEIAIVAGRMATRLTAARDTVAAMFAASDDLAFDNTLDHAVTTLTRKRLATDAVMESVGLALELGGGAAYGKAAGIERLFRDAHGALYHPLPAGQQELMTGRFALGVEPFGRP